MPSTTCGSGMRSITARRATSTTASQSCFTETNTLPVAWLIATQCAVEPTSIFSTLPLSGSIASTAWPSSPDDHNVPCSSIITPCGA